MGISDTLKKNVGGEGNSDSYMPTFAKATSAVFTYMAVVVFFGGVGIFLWRYFAGPSNFLNYVSIILCFAALYAFSEKTQQQKVGVFLPAVIFLIWYFVFQGAVNLTVIASLGGLFLVVSGIYGYFTKGGNVTPELYGLLPVLVLFLDIGLIALLNKEFNITSGPLYGMLIRDIPWWALFGLLMLPGAVSENKTVSNFIAFLKIVGFLYPFAMIVIAIMTAAPEMGSSQFNAPDVGEFTKAQQEELKKVSGESAITSLGWCISNGDYLKLQDCVKERQETVAIEVVCEKQRMIKKGSPAFDKCFKEEKEKKNLVAVSGVADPTINKPTTVRFARKETFPLVSFRTEGQPLKIMYPVVFEMENPRKQQIKAHFSCGFVGRERKDNITGEIVGKAEMDLQGESISRGITCKPEASASAQMKGFYDVKYDVKLGGLVSKSRLERAIIPATNDYDLKSSYVKEARQLLSSKLGVSMAAPDLSRLNFMIGNPPNDPVLDPTLDLQLFSSFENIGDGEIIIVNNYNIDIASAGLSVVDESKDCVNGQRILHTDEGKEKGVKGLSSCTVKLSELYSKIKEPVVMEISAELGYDYLLSQKYGFEVKVS